MANEAPATAVGILRGGVLRRSRHNHQRLLTDDGNPYRSLAFRAAGTELDISPRGTRPTGRSPTARPSAWRELRWAKALSGASIG